MKNTTKFNYFYCVEPLLEALNWRGDERYLHESSPYFQNIIDSTDLRNMMLNLGYTSKVHRSSIEDSNYIDFPYLFISKKEIYIVYGKTCTGIHIYNCRTQQKEVILDNHKIVGHIYSFKNIDKNPKEVSKKPWFKEVLWRFLPHFQKIIMIVFFSTLFTLTTPLFISSVYGWVIPAESYTTLDFLLLGMIMALVVDRILHHIKSKSMAYIGARVNMFIGIEVMRQLLFLPVSMVEGASIGNQVARIRQAEAVRELFTGPLAHLMIEAPFVLVFLGVLWYLGGIIVLIPVALIVVFMVAAVVILPYIREANSKTSDANQLKQNFLVETVMHILSIKQLAMEKVWQKRYHELYKDVALSQRFSQTISSHNQTISQMVMKIAGILTIFVSAYKVMIGEMPPGSLMAVVILVWRALSPIQLGFMILSQYDMIATSIAQLNRLTQLTTEEKPAFGALPTLEGHISFNSVSFKYPGENRLILQNVSFDVKPCEILAVIGSNSCGKSTLVKLLLNFYHPQAGSIHLDGMDAHHFDPVRLRQAIAYAPQQNQFFYGTIEQNLLLGTPTLQEKELYQALEWAGLLDDIRRLPDGIQTRMFDRTIKQFSSGFLQKLNLARAYCRPSKILIMDEPGNNLDLESDRILQETTKKISKEKTIILITHRPSMVNIADKILYLDQGFVKAFGPKNAVLEMLQKANTQPIEARYHA